MELKIQNKAKNIDYKICRLAIEFFANHLISPRLLNNIKIKVVFGTDDLDKKDYAEIWVKDEKYRVFNIYIKPNLSYKNTIKCIAHEMVHLKQFSTGEMKCMANGNKVKWCSKNDVEIFDNDKVDYWFTPWEIEAHGKELGMYYHFKKYRKSMEKGEEYEFEGCF